MFNNFFNKTFKINNINIGSKKIYIIAEAGSNHNGNFNQAIKLVDAAKYAGANAIKFQLFRSEYFVKKNTKDHKYLKKFEFKREWLNKLNKYCQKKRIDFLASPFDEEACELLTKIKVGAIKIASTETFNLKLINFVSKKNIPLIISTGISNYIDILEALEIIKKNNNKRIALLQCSSIYPTKDYQVNLNVIDDYKKIFDLPIGFSDHTLSILTSVAAAAKGAKIIEKHFTLSRSLKGPDHSFAIEPNELKEMVKNIRSIENMLGYHNKFPLQEELDICRKSGIYIKKNIKKNQTIKFAFLENQKPQKGIESRYLKLVEGLKINKDLSKGKPLKWKDIK